jgi:hypothetical protein
VTVSSGPLGAIAYYDDFESATGVAPIAAPAGTVPGAFPTGQTLVQAPGLFGQAGSSMGPQMTWSQAGNIDLSNPGSISFWIKPNQWASDNSAAQLVARDGNHQLIIESYQGQYLLQIQDLSQLPNMVTAEAWQGNTTRWATDTNWHLIVANWGTNYIALSVDSQAAATTTVPWLPSIAGPHGGSLITGLYGDSPFYFWDELLVLNRPMTDREIAWVWSTRTGPRSPTRRSAFSAAAYRPTDRPVAWATSAPRIPTTAASAPRARSSPATTATPARPTPAITWPAASMGLAIRCAPPSVWA